MQAEESERKEDSAKDYEDITGLEPPPASLRPVPRVRERPQPRARTPRVQTEASRMMGGLKSVKKLLERSSLLRSKRNLGLVQPQPQRRGPRRPKAILDGSVGYGDLPAEDARSVPMAHEGPELGDEKSEEDEKAIEDEAFWRATGEAEDAYVREDAEWRARLSEEERKRFSLQDFPSSALKRDRDGEEPSEEALSKRLKRDFYTTVMLAVSAADLKRKKDVSPSKVRANEWLGRSEVKEGF